MISIPKKLQLSTYQIGIALVVVYGAILLISIGQKAWVYEDAFITFRTIVHFVEGYGLRWNIDDRVQTYTHPLWMLLHIPFYALTKNIFLVTLGLCVICSIGACVVSLLHLRKKIDVVLLGGCFVAPLVFSKTFGIFATSGFESPLILILYSVFCMVYFGAKSDETPWLPIALIVALSATTRLDTVLLFLPLLIYLGIKDRKALPWKKLLIGFSPLIVWELFSLFYYGSLFPNTKYAKLDTGLPLFEFYIKRGIEYWLDAFNYDFLTGFIILLGMVVCGIWFYRWYKDRHDQRAAVYALIGLGPLLYVLYTIRIGGDYISLRFSIIPFFTFLLFLNYSISTSDETLRTKLAKYLVISSILVFGVHYAFLPNFYDKTSKYGITTMHYNKEHTLAYPLSLIKNNAIEYDVWTQPAREMSEIARRQGGPILRGVPCIGIQGFYSEPNVILTDSPSLSDALNARLPIPKGHMGMRMSHFQRPLPEGYEQARMHNDYSQMDPDLAEYYKKIRLITAGPLWSFERLKTIIAFNLGLYSKYRNAYLEKRSREVPMRRY